MNIILNVRKNRTDNFKLKHMVWLGSTNQQFKPWKHVIQRQFINLQDYYSNFIGSEASGWHQRQSVIYAFLFSPSLLEAFWQLNDQNIINMLQICEAKYISEISLDYQWAEASRKDVNYALWPVYLFN